MPDNTSMFAPLDGEEIPQAATIKSKSDTGTKTPIIPVPTDAPPMTFKHPKHGVPSQRWPYHDAEGQLVGYAARFDFINAKGEPDKDVLPITFCNLGDGQRGWRAKGILAPRPLYRLPDLVARPDAWVLVAEGEKAADAAAVLFPDMAATSPMHGAKSPQLTDWELVADRTVVIATDNDAAGIGFGDKVYELVRAAGAGAVFHLQPNALGTWMLRDGERVQRDGPIPEGWDVADALDEGWTAEAISAMRADPDFLVPYPDPAEPSPTADPNDAGQTDQDTMADWATEWPFRLTPHGVERRVEKEDRETSEPTVEWVWMCSPLEVAADTRDGNGRDWGRLLLITDRDGRMHEWPMPLEMLAGSGEEYRRELFNRGLILSTLPRARQWLGEYIQTAPQKAKAYCVRRPGWHVTDAGSAFVLPDATFGAAGGSRVLLQGPTATAHAFNVSGTLEDWQVNIASLCVGNSRLTLAVSAAFGAPLLEVAGEESGGVNFQGASRAGKSTALRVAGSVWGGGGVAGYIRPWRATANGLEGTAEGHCDCLLALDEMGQVDAHEAGEIGYMLSNGSGKQRASRDGSGRRPAAWRVLFLSTGELSLADKMMEAGKRAKAGQEVRLVDVPADAGAGMGMFEELHGKPDPDTFARHLRDMTTRLYGAPIRVYLTRLTNCLAADRDGLLAELAEMRRDFIAKHVPAGASGQVLSVAGRFALIAAGGELATALGVTGWPNGEAERAAATCFAAWLHRRGGAGNREVEAGIAQIRAFLEAHGGARFEPAWEPRLTDRDGNLMDRRVVNRAGFKRRDMAGEWEYLVPTETWKGEVCKGLDARMMAREMAVRGLLLPGSDGRSATSLHVPGYGQMKLYRLTGLSLCGVDGDSDGD